MDQIKLSFTMWKKAPLGGNTSRRVKPVSTSCRWYPPVASPHSKICQDKTTTKDLEGGVSLWIITQMKTSTNSKTPDIHTSYMDSKPVKMEHLISKDTFISSMRKHSTKWRKSNQEPTSRDEEGLYKKPLITAKKTVTSTNSVTSEETTEKPQKRHVGKK